MNLSFLYGKHQFVIYSLYNNEYTRKRLSENISEIQVWGFSSTLFSGYIKDDKFEISLNINGRSSLFTPGIYGTIYEDRIMVISKPDILHILPATAIAGLVIGGAMIDIPASKWLMLGGIVLYLLLVVLLWVIARKAVNAIHAIINS
jgi:hypothetical protein